MPLGSNWSKLWNQQAWIQLTFTESIKNDNDIASVQWEKRNNHFWKAYLIHETTATGACRANKGTRKDFWMAVPLAKINTLKKNLKIYQRTPSDWFSKQRQVTKMHVFPYKCSSTKLF